MDLKVPEAKQPLPKNAKRVFRGVVFDVYQWKQKMFDGSYQTFEKIKRPDTVMILPVTADGKIILTLQKQPGKKAFIGAVGGRVDKGENVLKAAERELLEETGYRATNFEIFDIHHAGGKIDWTVYTLIAKGCQKVSEMKLDSGERIKLKFVNFDEFLKILLSPKFQDSEIPSKMIKEGFLKLVWDKKKVNKLKKLFS